MRTNLFMEKFKILLNYKYNFNSTVYKYMLINVSLNYTKHLFFKIICPLTHWYRNKYGKTKKTDM